MATNPHPDRTARGLRSDGLPVLSYTEATAGGLAIDTVGVVRDTVTEQPALHAG